MDNEIPRAGPLLRARRHDDLQVALDGRERGHGRECERLALLVAGGRTEAEARGRDEAHHRRASLAQSLPSTRYSGEPNSRAATLRPYALDISERREASESREQLVDDLRAAVSTKDELLALVSHELRTPLTTLGGTANVLFRHGNSISPASKETALLDIVRGAERLEQIIENMLTIAHAERIQPDIFEPLLLNRVIASEFDRYLERRPLREAHFHPPDEILTVLGREGYVQQILNNLLSNAAKYGGQSAVDVSLERVGAEAIVAVADRGEGVVSQDQSLVFEAFFRSEEGTKRASGMGLGLTVCKRLVELQGGRIWYESREGGGSVFKFSLPIVEAEPD